MIVAKTLKNDKNMFTEDKIVVRKGDAVWYTYVNDGVYQLKQRACNGLAKKGKYFMYKENAIRYIKSTLLENAERHFININYPLSISHINYIIEDSKGNMLRDTEGWINPDKYIRTDSTFGQIVKIEDKKVYFTDIDNNQLVTNTKDVEVITSGEYKAFILIELRKRFPVDSLLYINPYTIYISKVEYDTIANRVLLNDNIIIYSGDKFVIDKYLLFNKGIGTIIINGCNIVKCETFHQKFYSGYDNLKIKSVKSVFFFYKDFKFVFNKKLIKIIKDNKVIYHNKIKYVINSLYNYYKAS